MFAEHAATKNKKPTQVQTERSCCTFTAVWVGASIPLVTTLCLRCVRVYAQKPLGEG